MKQGLPVSRPTRPYASVRGRVPLLGLLVLGSLALPAQTRAQDHAVVLVGDLGEVPPEDARAAFALVLAELRARQPETELRADSARAPAAAFTQCELARCRASWMLQRHAFAVVLVRFAAGASPTAVGPGEGDTAPRAVLELYDAGGQRVGAPFEITLTRGESGSFREALRAGVATLVLPRPSVVPLLVTCDVAAARIYLDDRPLGVVPLTLTRVTPGRHTLYVAAPGYEPHVQTLDLSTGGARVDVRLTARVVP